MRKRRNDSLNRCNDNESERATSNGIDDMQSVNGSESTDSSSVCEDHLRSSSKCPRNSSQPVATGRRRKTTVSARERNLRRLESNERERMRMHSLNDAFQGLREGNAVC